MDKRKKPRGLKKSKDQETSTPAPENSAQANVSLPASHALPDDLGVDLELALEKITDQSDMDIAELEALFNVATSKLDLGDTESATLLFNATVHESDKLLRTRLDDTLMDETETEHEETEKIKTVPPKLYYIYGSALLYIGKLLPPNAPQEPEVKLPKKRGFQVVPVENHPIAYFGEAEDRFDDGISKCGDGDKVVLAKLNLGKAMAVLEIVKDVVRSGDEDLTAKETVTLADKALDGYWKSVGVDGVQELQIEFAKSLLEFVELQLQFEEVRRYVDFCKGAFDGARNGDAAVEFECDFGVASCELSYVNSLFEGVDEDAEELDDSFPTEEATKRIDNAIKLFRKCQESEKYEMNKIKVLCLIGEALIQRGNLEDSEEAIDKYQEEASACFQQVQSMDPSALPVQFSEFLTDN